MFVKHNPKPAIVWKTPPTEAIERATYATRAAWADFIAQNGDTPKLVDVDNILHTDFWCNGPTDALKAVDRTFFALLDAMGMHRFTLPSVDCYDAKARIKPALGDQPAEGLIVIAFDSESTADFPDFWVFCASLEDAVRIRLGVGSGDD